jgi:ketosteroid isomerase-like protein
MGTNNGTQEIIQHYQDVFKRVPHHDSATVDQLSPLGSNAVITVGEYHLSGQGQNGPIKADGHYTAVDVLENGAWKIRLLTAVGHPPPPTSAAR